MNRKIRLTIDSDPIKYLINADERFIILYRIVGKLSFQLSSDSYSFIIETIIGQMLSNKVAGIIVDRLTALCDSGKIDVSSIKRLSIEELRAIGISRRKAECILDFTKKYNRKDYAIQSFSLLSDDEIIKKITSIKGLGSWSAKMFLLFVLGRENILPYEDMAFLQAFVWYNELPGIPEKNEIIAICKKWSPYISIAARYLYKALDMGLTKKAFSCYHV
jgi:DNA-3-methyladenine glycosylase II